MGSTERQYYTDQTVSHNEEGTDKQINFAANGDDVSIARNKIITKTLVKKANKQNIISNNSNFWKNNTRTNMVGIFYSYNSYIINICYRKNKLNELKLGLNLSLTTFALNLS